MPSSGEPQKYSKKEKGKSLKYHQYSSLLVGAKR